MIEIVLGEIKKAGNAYIRNLVAAEEAVLDGQFNLAKILRAVAYAQRAMAMNLARHSKLDINYQSLLNEIFLEQEASILPTNNINDERLEVVVEQYKQVSKRIQNVVERSENSLDTHTDVPENEIHQFLNTCYNCGNLIEGSKPEVCDICGALSTEFERFGPFYAADSEHLGQLFPESVVEILEQIPDAVERLLRSVADEILIWKPAADEWCIKEIIGHMIETDKMFAQRVNAIIQKQPYTQDVPPWKAQEGKGYEQMSGNELLLLMRKTRSDSLSIVQNLEEKQWVSTSFMLGGMRSVIDMGTWLANHDRGHSAQIQRMINERIS